MAEPYRSNHYVPQWYQRRFVLPEQRERKLHYLDMKPDWFLDGRGTRRQRKALRRLGTKGCFAADDLYTARLPAGESREIERSFFSEVDTRGRRAVEFLSRFDLANPGPELREHDPISLVRDLLRYMSTQKLRTPKGLEWLAGQVRAIHRNQVLNAMLRLQTLYLAVWSECVWQIASAKESDTKLIVTDHPVTVYNRACAPTNAHWCKGAADPDIRLHATQTLFALDAEHLLLLTNHSWAVNPYRSPTAMRPNPDFYRPAMFNLLDIQTGRHLHEREVREINYILKRRAWRYIAAAQEEWLYPEEYLESTDWRLFGKGHLLMPDPRSLTQGGEWVLSYSDGSFETLDNYGRAPGHPSFAHEARSAAEARTLARWTAEFERMFGVARRGSAWADSPASRAASA